MEQSEARKTLDKTLEQFGSPFMTATTKLLADPARCVAAIDDFELYGADSIKVTKEVAYKLQAMIDTIIGCIEIIAMKFNVDPVVLTVLLMFEAGRGYEREQTSIRDLEEMFKS